MGFHTLDIGSSTSFNNYNAGYGWWTALSSINVWGSHFSFSEIDGHEICLNRIEFLTIQFNKLLVE